MRKAQRLKRDARAAATWRGHSMRLFIPVGTREYKPIQWAACCRNCSAAMVVNIKPAPNEIDIGGTAVALNCPVNN